MFLVSFTRTGDNSVRGFKAISVYMCWVGVADIDLPIYPNYTIVRTCTITLYVGVLLWLCVVFFMILAQCLTSFSVK